MLKKFLLAVALVTAGVALTPNFAEAARIGGGRSAGMQRAMPRQMPRQATPSPAPAPNRAAPAATPRPAAAPAAQPSGWRKWAGPLAGIAGAIGLAALLSKFGMGGDFAGIILLVIGGLVAFMVIRRLLAGARPAQSQAQPAYAGMQQPQEAPWQAREAQPAAFGASSAAAAPEAEVLNVPAGFDVETFERQAKVNFIRLQAANDAGNIADIRDFTSPEMFAEIKLDIDSRKGRPQRTDVVELHAQVIEVVEEAGRYIASVRYFGSLREESNAAPQDFDEVWHLSKPVDGNQGWVLSGIQQLS